MRGAWVLMGFGGLTAAILLARILGYHELADTLRWPNVALGAGAAGYTAFLFGQCEGRDLWQNVGRTLPHLLVQALLSAAWRC